MKYKIVYNIIGLPLPNTLQDKKLRNIAKNKKREITFDSVTTCSTEYHSTCKGLYKYNSQTVKYRALLRKAEFWKLGKNNMEVL
jgi:hypothetical protein